MLSHTKALIVIIVVQMSPLCPLLPIMAKRWDSTEALSFDELDELPGSRPVATRLEGPIELLTVHAEFLYERYCSPKFSHDLTGSSTSPPTLFLQSLEALRKEEFLREWLQANLRCLQEDPMALNSFDYFARAESILLLTAADMVTLLCSRHGFSLR